MSKRGLDLIGKLKRGAVIPLFAEILALAVSATGQATILSDIERSQKLAQSTSLSRDCAAIRAESGYKRVTESWTASLDLVKQAVGASDYEEAKHALTLESTLSRGEFSTRTTFTQVADLINRSVVAVEDEDRPIYSFDGQSLKTVVTTGFVKHLCKYLLPEGTFEDLLAEPKRVPHNIADEAQKERDSLKAKANSLAAKYLVQSVRYSGIKIFLLGHESAHISLDRYSELLDAKDYQEEGRECLVAFYGETRADIFGLRLLRAVPAKDKLDEALRAHVREFSTEEIENMANLALETGFRDPLNVIDQEESSRTSTDCTITATQRRMQLEHALRSSQKSDLSPNAKKGF